MSTTQAPTDPAGQSSTVSYHAQAERLYESLFESRELCPICFAKKRSFYPEYDEAVATHLAGKNSAALNALGHRVDDEGGIQVNSATSDADPATYQDVVPERKKTREVNGEPRIGWEIEEPPRPMTVCQCGVIDPDFDNPRGTRLRFEAIENIAEHIWQREDDEDAFDLDAAKAVIEQARQRSDLSGHDQTVLVGAIELGLKHADE